MIPRSLSILALTLCTATLVGGGGARAASHYLSPMVTLTLKQKVQPPLLVRRVGGTATLPDHHDMLRLADRVSSRARGFVKGGLIILRYAGASAWGAVCDQATCVYHLPAGTAVTLSDIPTTGFTWHWWTLTPPGVHVTTRTLQLNLQAPITVTAVYLPGARG